MKTRYGAYVAGAWRSTGIDARAPWDGATVATISMCRPEDIEDAIAGAARAFHKTRKLATWERAESAGQVSSVLADRKDELATAMCLEGGTPRHHATRAGRADRRHLALQLPHQPGGPQDRPRARLAGR